MLSQLASQQLNGSESMINTDKLLSVISDILSDRYGCRIKAGAERQANDKQADIAQPGGMAEGKGEHNRRL